MARGAAKGSAWVRRAAAMLVVGVALLVPAGAWIRQPPRGSDAPAAAARSDVDADLRRLDEAIDRLEERLLADQAAVSLWSQLRDRHQSVSEVACTNLGEHAEAMARHAPPPRQKKRAPAARERLATRAATSDSSSR